MKKALTFLVSIIFIFNSYGQSRDSITLDQMIGQMIMVGIGDFDMLRKSEPIFQDIRTGKVGGIILFEKNINRQYPADYLKEIINYAQESANIPLWVSIDEEGGKVNRLKPKYGFPKTVTAQYLGELDNLDSTRHYAFQTAQTLNSLGINLNFAPTLDVNVNPDNPVIGNIGRSYSGEFDKVAKHAAEVVRIHDSLKVGTALKHFPGHGSSRADTHLGIADVSDTWRISEIYPYKSLMDSGLVRMIMTAHIVNGIIDPEKNPATLSKKVVTELLRGLLEYDGVVISDDMQMGAISKEYGLEQAIAMSINAGVDILLFANNVPDAELVSASQIHSIIKSLIISEKVSMERVEESYQRIMKLKGELIFE